MSSIGVRPGFVLIACLGLVIGCSAASSMFGDGATGGSDAGARTVVHVGAACDGVRDCANGRDEAYCF